MVCERVREIHKAPEVEGDIFDGAVLTGLDTLAKEPNLLFVRVAASVCARENALDADLLFGIVQKIGHSLRALDHRKRQLRLRRGVVCRSQIPKPDQLVLWSEALFQPLEQRDRPIGLALLEKSASLEQRELRSRRRGSSAEKIRRFHTQNAGDVLERFHRCARAAGLEHGDIGLGVLRLRYLSLGKALRC